MSPQANPQTELNGWQVRRFETLERQYLALQQQHGLILKNQQLLVNECKANAELLGRLSEVTQTLNHTQREVVESLHRRLRVITMVLGAVAAVACISALEHVKHKSVHQQQQILERAAIRELTRDRSYD